MRVRVLAKELPALSLVSGLYNDLGSDTKKDPSSVGTLRSSVAQRRGTSPTSSLYRPCLNPDLTLEDVDDYGQYSMRIRYGICTMAESNGKKPEAEDALAFAVDGENYTASLETSPDYGCNQHEEREPS